MHPHNPEVNLMIHSTTTSTHAAHVATSREGSPDGGTEATNPKDRDTAQRGEHGQRGTVHYLPTVTFPRPRCPECGHVHLQKFRSIRDQGDGSSLAWVKCLNDHCGHRFKLLLE